MAIYGFAISNFGFSRTLVKKRLNKEAYEAKLRDTISKVASKARLKNENGHYNRVISAMHLSRSEDFYSINQSDCNYNCLKYYSWEFSKHIKRSWYSADDFTKECRQFKTNVTVTEPREQLEAHL